MNTAYTSILVVIVEAPWLDTNNFQGFQMSTGIPCVFEAILEQ